MKRRLFLLSGTASAAAALTGCGGGGSTDEAGASSAPVPQLLSQHPTSRPTRTTTTTTTTTTTATATSTTTATSTAAAAVAYPFGARLAAYAAAIRPSQSAATMDSVLTAQYDAWKAARIVSAASVVSGGYADQFSNTTYLTVSEGMGYAMLLAVLFAGHDAKAQQLFDGLLAVVRKRYAYAVVPYDPNGKYLMDWRLNADGTSAGDGWNAMDGDLDIAMALLMAHRQWGSSGTWNYLQEGKNTIAGIKSWCMASDGTTKGLAKATVSRTSDYMIGHFRAFQAATGDTFWSLAVDRAYYLADRMQTVYSAGAGLMPDFIVGTETATPSPSPGFMGDGNANENKYWWNACRNPWRYASDYVLSADARWKTVTARIVNCFQAKVAAAGGDVTVIGTGYNLDGSLAAGGNDAAYMAPIMLGGCIDASYQGLVDALWKWNASHLTTGYYDSEIQLLSMVAAAGNWWSPPTAYTAGTAGTSTTPATTTSSTPPPAAAANILANGDFSSGMTGWTNWGNAAVLAGAVNVGSAAGGFAQDVWSKLTPGARYQLTATAKLTLAAEGVFVGVKLMDGAGAELINQTQVVTSLTPTGVTIAFTAPAGAASGYVYVWKNANSAIAVLDNFSLVAA
jgi:hypothetical protein